MPEKSDPSNPGQPEDESKEIDLTQKEDYSSDELTPQEIRQQEDFDKRHKKDALRLLGLDKKYDVIKNEEKETTLKSPERIKAFESIDTSTNPRRSNIEKKQGIISEIIKKGLVSEEVLKNNPLLYLGSGTDVEYPLALGSRKIIMADFMLQDVEVRQYIADRIKSLINKEVTVEGDEFVFNFDFGEGEEVVRVKFIGQELASQYNENHEKLLDEFDKQIPDNVGIVIKYASHGPAGSIIIDDKTKAKIIDGGVILEEDTISKKDVKEGTWQDTELGKEKE
ncbi:MAG: hypothetical protein EXS48_02955 [Candidatus Staskawiczbacteria bacterium]|nr:hypothetical protein [Candidatus Staskawiczbacteria bacterium]